MNPMARRMFELVEPIDEPNEAMFAMGFTNYRDTYFAGLAAPPGLTTAEVVEALLYDFAIAARYTGCVKALRRILAAHDR